MTYAELVQEIQDYLENSESTFVSSIPSFVEAAEQAIYRMAKLPATRNVNTSVSTAASTDTITIPAGVLAPINVQLTVSGSQINLTLRDESYIKEAYPSGTGVPTTYAIRDHVTWALGPTPDAIYPVFIEYYGFPESIVTAGSSWLGTYAPAALRWGSISEAYAFMKGDPDMMQDYDRRFKEAVTLLSVDDAMLEGDRFTSDSMVG